MEKILEAYSNYTRARDERSAWLRDNSAVEWLTSEEYRKLDREEFRAKAKFVATVEDSEHYGMFEVYKYATEEN
jgi:hypothetical protein